MLVKPRLGVLDDGLGAAFDASPALPGVGFGGKVVVEIEATIEAGSECLAVEDDGSDEGGGLISLFFEQFSPGDVLGRERNSEIGDTVDAGQQAGEDGGVRRVGDGAVRERMGEANAVRGDRVDGGSFDLLVSVAGDVVGTQGVDGDEEDVGLAGGGGRRLGAEGGLGEYARQNKDEDKKNGESFL